MMAFICYFLHRKHHVVQRDGQRICTLCVLYGRH